MEEDWKRCFGPVFKLLLPWYKQNKRSLPWRETCDPYQIWLSEIMLQQTRVEAVKPYFINFLMKLPSVSHLAKAKEETVLKLWEGLGYYSRIKNMQKAAIMIQEEYNGTFPVTAADWEKLPGVGPYTSGAIASICFDEPVAAVDGNVLRVASRLAAFHEDITTAAVKKSIARAISSSMSEYPAGQCNQALMELGATICIPNGTPLCQNCPLTSVCEGFTKDTAGLFPVKTEKKKRRQEHRVLFFCTFQGRIALRKRDANGLLAGLWELPNCQAEYQEDTILSALDDWGMHPQSICRLKDRKHVFTHVEWQQSLCAVAVDRVETHSPFLFLTPEEISKTIPLPTAFKACYQEGLRHFQASKD